MAVTWTQADIDLLKAAIIAVATGTKAVSVSYAGPPARSVTYNASDLAEMRALLAEMNQSVSASAGTTTNYRLAATRKGV